MPDNPQPIIDQVEDAVLKFIPIAGGVIGGLVAAGALRKTVPPFLAFVLGGALGGAAVYLACKLLFRVINPGRKRS